MRTFGVLRALTDTVYNMNFDHLHRQQLTVFEQLDDMGVRTACTPFLIFRGRTRHEIGVQGWMRRVAQAANFRHPVYGPSELFYGELYSSQEVDCRPTLARPGTRDPYSGCVGAYVERHDLYDFMLFSLPDNDHHSHRFGPQATVDSIARADRHLAELAEPAGGIESFLDDHAVILMSDHAQVAVSEPVNLAAALVGLAGAAAERPARRARPSWRSRPAPGPRWSTGSGRRRSPRREAARLLERLQEVEAVEVLAWKDGDQACVWTDRGELRFSPGTAVRDLRGDAWDVDGRLETLELEVRDGTRGEPHLPRRAAADLVRAGLRRRGRRARVGRA